MDILTLSNDEAKSLEKLLAEISSAFDSVEDPVFLAESGVIAQEIPRRVRAFLHDFRRYEPAAGCCGVAGFPVDQAKVGLTPSPGAGRPERSPALEEEILLVLLGSLLGEVMGWSTQQDGRIVHDIFPIRGCEDEQLGCGSETTLAWHTEDAFHEFRSDYVALMCLRNPTHVGTTLGTLKGIAVPARYLEALFAERFLIRPDKSHLDEVAADFRQRGAASADAHQHMVEKNRRPNAVAVLFGDRRAPYLRIDPSFMETVPGDDEARQALDFLVAAIDANLRDFDLWPGTFLFIDNYMAVHGRRAFQPAYDGSDRWLKRLNVTRDLRKSRVCRSAPESPVIH
jgi:Fe(II)/alpha-ketoglutarate-dependent arginine beta-hydroxylase